MSDVQHLIDEGEVAGDYLERLLDILDFDGDIDLDVIGDRAVVSIVGGDDLGCLAGADGHVLDAIQELTRLAVGVECGERSRLILDIGGWRATKKRVLSELAAEVAERVEETGEAEAMEPMTPFERKVIHDAIGNIPGLTTISEGEGPERHVVVLLDEDDDDEDDEI